MCHQAHVIQVENGRTVRDTVYRRGRWGSALMAEMAEAESDAVAV